MSLVDPYLESPKKTIYVVFFKTVLIITVFIKLFINLIISYFYEYLITEKMLKYCKDGDIFTLNLN